MKGVGKQENQLSELLNLSNYVQDKFQQTAHLRVISDDDCSCGH